MAATHPAQPELRRALDREVERRFGRFGGVERRGASPDSFFETDLRSTVSGDPETKGQMQVRGYASVFNRLSLDLGGFREKILPGAFDNALGSDPHTLLLWDHQGTLILGSTRANDPESLELRADANGLRFFSRVVDTTYSRDLSNLMDAGIVKQASFAFTVERDAWTIDENDNVTRTIIEVAGLFDVTITAMGAYPQTVSNLVRAYAYDFGHESGRLNADVREEADSDFAPLVAEGVTEVTPSRTGGGDQEEREALDAEAARQRLEALRTDIRRRKI